MQSNNLLVTFPVTRMRLLGNKKVRIKNDFVFYPTVKNCMLYQSKDSIFIHSLTDDDDCAD